ncbi:MHYT domain-containing protein [Actinokineospora pegani]|uniref:MHYT domain-containing protein n=1 Tax=Actinokineospora pegani TaxID=2654637 RepID=UPI001A9A83A7|nr:MHYT domain-containing protein [Actinokineospora pegani]
MLSALSIGGTGIWVMYFVAMLGFAVDDTEIRYDLPRTLVSLALSTASCSSACSPSSLGGMSSYSFFAPLAMIIGLITAASLLTVAISASEQEIEEELWVESQLTDLASR